uniref:Uncharacterized protein n=1 Tax=Anguilla anguilla TaxID=7936 RepID=A0A0E9RPV6_ANGAN
MAGCWIHFGFRTTYGCGVDWNRKYPIPCDTVNYCLDLKR